MPFLPGKVQLVDPALVYVYDCESLLKQLQHLLGALLAHNEASFRVPMERDSLHLVESHVTLVLHNSGHKSLACNNIVLCFDGISNLLEAPYVLIGILETLNGVYYRSDLRLLAHMPV